MQTTDISTRFTKSPACSFAAINKVLIAPGQATIGIANVNTSMSPIFIKISYSNPSVINDKPLSILHFLYNG